MGLPAFLIAASMVSTLLTQPLPHMNGSGLTLHVIEVTYRPGESSTPHSHACPVSVYVAAGALRERVDNEPVKIVSAGQSFYEPPNHVHVVSANASAREPARFIATFVCDRETQLSTEAHP